MANLTGNSFNLSKSENAILEIQDLPEVSFFLTSFEIPGISTGTIDRPNPFKQHFDPGNKLTYDSMNVEVIVDEDFQSWQAIKDWILEGNNGFTFASKDITRRTGNIILTTNSLNPQFRLTLRNMFPVSMGSIQIDLQQAEATTITFPVELQYESYEFHNLTSS